MDWPINAAGVALVQAAEGLRLTPYLCPAGRLTVGWGHTGRDIKVGESVTIERAEELLRRDLGDAADAVKRLVLVPVSENQRAALVSLVFNIGAGAFATSTLLRRLNAGLYGEAAGQFPRWVHGGGRKLPGLVSRREAERRLFLTPDA